MSLRAIILILLRRGLSALFSLWLLSVLIFASLSLVKGDAASVQLAGRGSAEQVAVLRNQLGLDQTLPVRYGHWLFSMLQGDWGKSYSSGRPVSELLVEHGRYSLQLGLVASVLLVLLSLVFGIWSGLRPGGKTDTLISFTALGFLGVPEFVTGTLLILVFALKLNWFPALSLVSADSTLIQQLSAMALPILTLLSVCLAQNIRLIRLGVIEASLAAATQNARLNGFPERLVIRHWVLPVALVRCLPVMARYVTYLLGGALVAETLFSWPGLAAALVNATLMRDTPVIMGIAMVICAMTLILNQLADSLTTLLTPAARQGGEHV